MLSDIRNLPLESEEINLSLMPGDVKEVAKQPHNKWQPASELDMKNHS